MKTLSAFHAGAIAFAAIVGIAEAAPPAAKSSLKPPKFVQAAVKIDREKIPPTPPLERIKLTTDEKVTDPDAVTLWIVMPVDKVFQTVSMTQTSCEILVREDQAEQVYTYAWIAKEKGKPQQFVVGQFKAGKGPRPPPDPDPDPVDPPVPDEAKLPFPPTGFHAMFLKQDTEAKEYTPVQKAAVWGGATADYLNAHATPLGPTQWPAWRVYDVNQQFGAGEDPFWQKAWEKAVADYATWKSKNPGKQAPWLLAGNGTKGYSGPVDAASLDKTLETLKKLGGP